VIFEYWRKSMSIDRRELFKTGVATAAAILLPGAANAMDGFAARLGTWRNTWRKFQVVTRVEIAKYAAITSAAKTQVWVPLPLTGERDWFMALASDWTSDGQTTLTRDPKYDAAMLRVEWPAGSEGGSVRVTSTIATRDRAIDFAAPATASITAAERALYTRGTDRIPVDGIVKETANKIVATASAATDLEKARAIYEWMVDNTFRDRAVRGCGSGDIAAMLRSGTLGGKCADLNGLFVGLLRSAGIPARDVYGIRLAASKLGYRSLGASSAIVTNAQHCRAEVFLADHGWVAADPADVRKVVLEEAADTLPLDDAKVVAMRRYLFGAWEGNWLPYNSAHDIALPGSPEPTIAFLMYPQGECAGTRLDCLDADAFKYTITAHEVTA
jgi:transglutaminase-like putative cysteine protease